MRKNINIGILICMIALILIGLHKLDVSALGSVNFNKLTIENGLSQSTALRIYQDSKGYMWVGTTDGLNRYNGNEFEIYKYSNTLENSISSNYIYSIVEDDENNIWIGTSSGVNKINIETGQVKVYLPSDAEGGISHSQIEGILIDSKKRVWICTADGLNIYNPKEDNFKRVLFSEDKEKSLSNQFAHTITEDSMGRIWIGTPHGLNMYDESSETVKKFFYDENDTNTISSDDICEVYADGDYIWVGTVGGGLNKINIKTFDVKRYISSDDNNSLENTTIRDILKDSRGKIWLATNNGLVKFNEKEEKFTLYTAKLYESNGLVSNDILCLFENKDGTIWVGTSNGISIFNNENMFTNYKHDPLDINSLSSNMSSGIYEDDEGLVWVGTLDSGVNVIDEKNNKIIRYVNNPVDSNSIPSNYVRDIVGKGNDIWISTNMGLSHYNKSSKEFTNYSLLDGEENSIISNSLRALFVDNEGLLWIGTAEGICTLDNEGKFVDYTALFKSVGINDSTYVEIFQDSEGIMWFGLLGDTGLVKYNKKTGEIKVYKNTPENENSISFNTVRAINEDSTGNLWIGTAYGLNKFDKETEQFTTFIDEDGLANSYIYGVLVDNNDNIWVSTNSGISNLIVEENRIINYDVSDGIASSEMNGYSFFKCQHGDMIFGGVGGITIFNPSYLETKSYSAKVVLEDVQTIGREKINASSEIELNYRETELTLNFFLPDYRNVSKVEYAYKLEGIDEQWVYAGKSNVARYTNLPGGSYKFLVTARNSRGDWSDISSIVINKEVAPWESPLAYFIYILAFGSILYLTWNHVKILDNLVIQRTKELSNKLDENKRLYDQLIRNEKYKNNYFVNLSHELRTPLNVIVSIEQLVTSLNDSESGVSKEKLSNYMITLRRNSKRLLNLINNIIDTSKIESGSYRLDIETNDIVYLVEEIALSMVEFSNASGIELVIDPEIEEKEIMCDKKEIEKCVVNLIANAVKFTPIGGEIKLTIVDLGKNIEIRVKDTGIGIDEKFHKAIFNRFGQAYNEVTEEHGGSGLGLTLTKHLVELHGGEIKLNSSVGKGSEFIIVLPVDGPKKKKM